MLVTEQARVESWQLGLSLKGRRRRPNSRIVRGSCPAQVGSKKTRLARVSNRDTISTAANLESRQLGLSLKGRRRRPNSRIARGSCPAQVGSKKTRLARVSNRDTISTAANRPQVSTCSVSVHGRVGRISPICQEEGLNDRVLSRNRYRI
jgi:hypothetical protein